MIGPFLLDYSLLSFIVELDPLFMPFLVAFATCNNIGLSHFYHSDNFKLST
jgi:hypothetical protein